MNLVYLYIYSFRSIRRKSFNFDSNYHFSMEDGELSLNPSGFGRKIDWNVFFKGNGSGEGSRGRIANISAIIGRNGSGKTSLAFILQQLVLGRPEVGGCLAVFTGKSGGEKEFYVCKVETEECKFRVAQNLAKRVEEGPFVSWRSMVYYSPLYTTQHVIQGDGVRVFDASATATMKAAKNVAMRDGSRGVVAMTQSDNYDVAEMRSVLEVLENPLVPFLRKKEMFGLKVAPSVYTMSMYVQGGATVSQSEMDEHSAKMLVAKASSLEMPYLDVSIDPPLSSGEASYYLMYARLLASINSIRRLGDETCNRVLLYLDECETALHPERQRELVDNIVKFCSLAAFGIDVQVIIATHSPLLLSDIPGGNVCIMQDDGDKLPCRSFCANIFDLYRLGFGVLNGQWGVFARGKIEGLLKKANEGSGFDEAEECVIEFIGDPIVRNYLKKCKAELSGRQNFRKVRNRDYLPEIE